MTKASFFLDEEDVMYRHQSNGKHQLVAPQTLVRNVIRQNHDLKFVAHPGVKRTHNLISLSYWWPHMRKTIEEYVRRYDCCRRRKENLKSNLRLPYGVVTESNKKSHQVNKQYYDRKAKQRDFEVNDLAYLYSSVKKSGLAKKFFKLWRGPYLITRKLSALNYELTDQNVKTQVVHVNRLKRAYNSESWTPSQKRQPERKPRGKQREETDGSEEDEFSFRHFPLANTEHLAEEPGHEPQTDHSPNPLPSAQQPMDTPTSKRSDPSYYPPRTPLSRQELQTTRTEPPLTRSRARVLLQNFEN
jgi:hypothetical protein